MQTVKKIKTKFEGKTTCRRHRMTQKNRLCEGLTSSKRQGGQIQFFPYNRSVTFYKYDMVSLKECNDNSYSIALRLANGRIFLRTGFFVFP
jgi:hypothetical protein